MEQQVVDDAVDVVDVVVVGGGPAGLSCAVALGRARRRVLVVDAGRPRNASAAGVHNHLGREGSSPAQLLADARADVARYGGEVRSGTATALEVLERPSGEDPDAAGELAPRVRVRLAGGAVVDARAVVVATGLVDELPDLPGLAARWGRDVLHCPYCHGWEVRDAPIAVLATGPLAVHQAQLFRQWSADVVLLTHDQPAPGPVEAEELAARGIAVVAGRVVGVDVVDDALTGVRLEGGEVVARSALVVGAPAVAASALLTGLGVEVADLVLGGWVAGSSAVVDATGATSVPGVWAAGNVVDARAQVVSAAAAGLAVAAAVNTDLVGADVRAAVASARATAAAWDAQYAERERWWSGEPNPVLAATAADLPPGTALDLGCGEGGDAVWLAARGWRVTAVDVSATALARTGAAAAAAGVAERASLERHDLGRTFPAGVFDLVSAQFLHSPDDLPRAHVLRRAARAVAPGGLLLVVGHASVPPWAPARARGVHLPGAAEVLADLRLDPDRWVVERAEDVERPATGPDGQPGTVADAVVAVRRLS